MSDWRTMRQVWAQTDDPMAAMAALRIDPDMTVTELQRRLKIAERVLSDPAIDLPDWATGEREAFIFDSGVDATLSWLTREDDQ